MLNYPYIFELLSPKRSIGGEAVAQHLDRFAERYRRIIDLLYKSVGKEKDETAQNFDPTENLKALHAVYPECSVYLSMLSFKQDWHQILPRYLQ